MSFEIRLPFGSIFTFGAGDGGIFAAFVPQVVAQARLILVRPITLVTLEWHDWTILGAC